MAGANPAERRGNFAAQLLGLEPDALERRLRIVRPTLPRFADSLDLCGLRVGDATVDLRFERDKDGAESDAVRVTVLNTKGKIDVAVESGADA